MGLIVWMLFYSVNLMFWQIGLILFLVGVGVNFGYIFVDIVVQGGGGIIFLVGIIISFIMVIVILFIGYKLLKIFFSFLMGMVASQLVVFDFVLEKVGNKLFNIGFMLMLFVFLIIKIVYV